MLRNIFYEADGANAAEQTDTSTEETQQEQKTDNTILGNAKPDVTEGNVPESYDLASVIPEGFELNQERMDSFTAVAKEGGLSQENAS